MYVLGISYISLNVIYDSFIYGYAANTDKSEVFFLHLFTELFVPILQNKAVDIAYDY